MLPSEIMIWQPEFTDKILSRKPGAVHIWWCNIGTVCWQTCMRRNICITFTNKFISSGQQIINFYGPCLFTHSECHYASLTI
ncbi:hypothetical protein DPI72_28370 [Escherichia coli]|nr:hypothetical protein [Escherichia coli]